VLLLSSALLAALVTLAVAFGPERAAGETSAPTTSYTLEPGSPNGQNGWYTSPVTVTLNAADNAGGSGIDSTEYRVDGGPWQNPVPSSKTILGSLADYNQWLKTPCCAASWQWNNAGNYASAINGPLGMLWYPVEYGDFSLKLEWRDVSTGANGNGGVFVRFPDIRVPVQSRPPVYTYNWAGPEPPAQTYAGPYCGIQGSAVNDPGWYAVYCGQEIQINDWQSDAQKTGSVYNFKPLNQAQGGQDPRGTWVDYGVQVVGQQYTITRNGQVINQFNNAIPLNSSRSGDPPTQARQFARGYIGLQNHSANDKIDYRNVRIQDLTPGAPAEFTVSDPGQHTIEYRSTDVDGNVEPTKSFNLKIDPQPPVTTHVLSGDWSPGGTVNVALSADDSATGSGVASIEYAAGKRPPLSKPYEAYSGPIPISGDGRHYVEYRAIDNAGNAGAPWHTRFVIGQPGPDNTSPPVLSRSSDAPSKLICSPGEWTQSGPFDYQWLRDGVAFANPNSKPYRYRTTDDDAGTQISCGVRRTSRRGPSSFTESNAIAID
jgi:hypothetical protein